MNTCAQPRDQGRKVENAHEELYYGLLENQKNIFHLYIDETARTCLYNSRAVYFYIYQCQFAFFIYATGSQITQIYIVARRPIYDLIRGLKRFGASARENVS